MLPLENQKLAQKPAQVHERHLAAKIWKNISVCGAVIYWAVGYAFAYGVLDNDPNGVNKFIGSKYFFTWVKIQVKIQVELIADDSLLIRYKPVKPHKPL